jgi:hypothetical protein
LQFPRKDKAAAEETMKAAMVFLASAALVCAPPLARAADYPSKPVTLMIGFAPGGPSDVMARILTKKMEEILKQPLVIENRAGAGGSIAGAAVARAAPDGYTVLLATGSLLAINVSLYKNIGYDPERDFEPIGLIGTQTNVLYLNPSVPATSLAELIAYAKANTGKMSQRHAGASGGRVAQARSQDRHHACAVPRHRAGAASRHRWARSDGVQPAVTVAPSHPERHDPRARDHDAQADGGVARGPDHRRVGLSRL